MRIKQFAQTWNDRAAQTGGSFDAQLRFGATGQAQQKFRVRGLDAASLTAGPTEKLTFAVGSRDQRITSSVTVGGDVPTTVVARRLDLALSSSGIRVIQDQQGELRFSVNESAWTSVRDTLSIKGEGRRFSTGQFNQVRTVAQTSAVRPEEWGAQDTATAARTLLDVRRIRMALAHSRSNVSETLTQAADQFPADTDSATACENFVQTFSATTRTADFSTLAALAPALSGIDKRRVLAVLSL